ncbi:alkaline phosphatase PhoX [Yinghuangia soli]|uniref:PhoX family protein n=1 Tax=Yinghuangia soli TaxID=2908204 RepID=A0AA41PYK1_9ACTN|nr:alkaline phosphatase PhoX [Yinghuangia soli]MCF2527962.1 PhoX family protein [Yinghuangia soli]
MERRSFLTRSAAVTGAALVAGPFQGLVAHADSGGARRGPGFGALRPVPDGTDGVVRLQLPKGFTYRSFGVAGETMSDGVPTPGRHDGMAAFPGRHGGTVLVRNHEVPGISPAFGNTADAYDASCGGGTTTLTLDRRGRLVDHRVSLNGTVMNCSGGPMPWGAWVTCEESVDGPEVVSPFPGQDNTKLTRKHGYLFEVPLDRKAKREPIRNAGRFQHEAAAFDPVSGAVFLTEDNFVAPCGFYRYLPPVHPMKAGRLLDGGKLQMLAVRGKPNAALQLGHERGTTYDVDWVDIPNPDPSFAPGTSWFVASAAVSSQGLAAGAAMFSRLEGATYCNGTVYFCSTQGGATAPGDELPPVPYPRFGEGRGQVWAYDVRRKRLRLVYESPHSQVLDLPDNIACSPSGTLILCEDGDGDNYLRGVTTSGALYDLAKLVVGAGDDDAEFAGATFSADGETMFVNMQALVGRTFAIRGPWDRC